MGPLKNILSKRRRVDVSPITKNGLEIDLKEFLEFYKQDTLFSDTKMLKLLKIFELSRF